jgi:DNA-binding NarL/FixJ family response regulator
MDGIECYTQLKRIDPNVRVVFCTGHSRAEATERLGAQDVPCLLTKPCTSDELTAALAQILKTKPQLARSG